MSDDQDPRAGLPDYTDAQHPEMAGPDPADYALLPPHADIIRSIMDHPDLQAFPPEMRWSKTDLILGNHRRHHGSEMVAVPDSNDQLGYRWTKVFTPAQIAEARDRGLFRYLLAGHDPDGLLTNTSGQERTG